MNGLPDQVRAALFDLDGVLTPTASIHAAAWARVFDEVLLPRGLAPFDPVGEYDRQVDGKPRADGARDFFKSRGVDLPEAGSGDTIETVSARKDQVFAELVASRGVAPYPGSMRYLHAARDAGLRTAVVSASRHCEAIVEAAGLRDLLDVRVDGVLAASEGLAGKPAPDTFLRAARALDAPPSRAAVFEDAVAGVEAGRAGHFGYVVGVNRVDKGDGTRAREHASELWSSGADVVASDLSDLLDSEPPDARQSRGGQSRGGQSRGGPR